MRWFRLAEGFGEHVGRLRDLRGALASGGVFRRAGERSSGCRGFRCLLSAGPRSVQFGGSVGRGLQVLRSHLLAGCGEVELAIVRATLAAQFESRLSAVRRGWPDQLPPEGLLCNSGGVVP